MRSYDSVPVNSDLVLDLPYREGSGVLTYDHAKPHHAMTLNDPGGGSFAWTTLASGLMVPRFVTIGGGATDGVYIDSPGAGSADLNFTTGSYSLSAWVNWADASGWSQIVMGRNEVNVSGWELFLTASAGATKNNLTVRHSHASLTPNLASSCFSVGWTQGQWVMVGVSRTVGILTQQHYKNGVPLKMNYESTGMLDAETCAQDLNIGCRYTKDANWFKGYMYRPRIWDRPLSHAEWIALFEDERDLFGV